MQRDMWGAEQETTLQQHDDNLQAKYRYENNASIKIITKSKDACSKTRGLYQDTTINHTRPFFFTRPLSCLFKSIPMVGRTSSWWLAVRLQLVSWPPSLPAWYLSLQSYSWCAADGRHVFVTSFHWRKLVDIAVADKALTVSGSVFQQAAIVVINTLVVQSVHLGLSVVAAAVTVVVVVVVVVVAQE